MKLKRLCVLVVCVFSMSGCWVKRPSTNHPTVLEVDQTFILSEVVMYKTKSNYNQLVPVRLSEDKSQIISYPHPKDVMLGKTILEPVVLNDGYLMDRIGIGENVAYLGITLMEYSQLQEPMPISEMLKIIVDNDPLKLICNCGPKTAEISISKLQEMIQQHRVNDFCKVKVIAQ